MPLLLAGIDEAGYGPLLGPLCVGMSVVRIEGWSEGDPAPNLWTLLAPRVSRKPGKNGLIAINDSKQLKLANDSKTGHPLTHLERAVLACLRCEGDRARGPEHDRELHDMLAFRLDPLPHYGGDPIPLPVAWTAAQLEIAANMLRAALAGRGVSLAALRCHAIAEPRFNDIVDATRNKADASLEALGAHLRTFLALPAHRDDSLRVVCDRLGGRTQYAPVLGPLARSFDPRAAVTTLEETDRASRYELAIDGRRIVILFQTEADSAHLPVALASMIAKYTRELAMARFNRYWTSRFAALATSHASDAPAPELKPTAGYRTDAWRWLRDAAPILTADDRRALIRRA